MEREHLIIIALILVAIYVMNKDDSKDTVSNVGPLGRIRYEEDKYGPLGRIRYEEDKYGPLGHIRHRREGFEAEDPANMAGSPMGHIRYSDKYIGQSQHIKNSIRYDNRDRMFNGMFAGSPQRIRVCEDGMPC